MKKKRTVIVLFMLNLVILNSAFGQEKQAKNAKIGLGVSLFNYLDYGAVQGLYNLIYVPIDRGELLRIEPTIGFLRIDNEQRYFVGFGVFGRKTKEKINLLYGARLGVDSRNDVVVAPTFGAEYYFVDQFSIGAEVQLKASTFAQKWIYQTNSMAMIRFYF